jgi:drug/metabolite transporter (DMT)-like permease
MADHKQDSWLAAMPAVFVLLWSSGFIGAKYGLPYAEPLTFLLLRFVLVAVLLMVFSFATKAPWPRSGTEIGHIAVAGLLVHAGYLAGVFCAIHQGVSAGVIALIAGLQPVLTAAAASPLLGEQVSGRQWFGFALGLIGVALVVSGKLALGAGSLFGYALALVALLCITAGTLYQKRFCSGMDLRTGAVVQFAASAALMLVLAPLLETMQIRWSREFIFALAWLVCVLSLGAITLLFMLIRRGAASRVSSLFYLVPPVTALMAYIAFDERLSPSGAAGMVVTVTGVALVLRRPRREI